MPHLILQRKTGEETVVQIPACDHDRELVIRIEEVRGYDKVRLGFETDKDVKIHRREVIEQIRREQEPFAGKCISASGNRPQVIQSQ